MTEPSIPFPEVLDESVKTKEKFELFPDEPVGRPAEFRDKIDTSEAANVRQRTKTDDKRDQTRERARQSFTDEGKLTFRIEGEDDNKMVFSCNSCRALVLKSGIYEHSAWHEEIKLYRRMNG